MTFRIDATIHRVDAGRLLEWRAHDRQQQPQGPRLVAPAGWMDCRFTEVVEGRLLGGLRPLSLGPLLAWPLRRQRCPTCIAFPPAGGTNHQQTNL